MLTPREELIASLVAKGMSDKAIAKEAGISPKTVHNHITNAADRIPGEGRARYKVMIWYLSLTEDSDAA